MVKGYKHTEVGITPEDWESTLFGDLISHICYGPRFSSEGYSEFGNVRTIRGTDINQKGDIKYQQVPTAILPDVLIKEHKLEVGDLVMITTADCGLTGIYIEQDLPHIASAYAVRISLNERAYPLLFKYLFQTKIAKHQIELFIRKGTVPNLPSSDISKLRFPIPPTLAEQKAIAQALTDIDNLITKLDKLIAKKKAIKQGAMQELLTSKRRLKGFTGDWDNYNIESLCKTFTKQTGFDYSNHIKPKLTKKPSTDVIPFIQNKDFNGKKINFNTDYYVPIEIAKRFPMILLDEKCLLISISGSIGNVAVFNNKKIAFIGGAVAVGKFNFKNQLEWVMYYLMSNLGQEKLLKNVKAGSHQNLILDDIRKITIPIPCEEEQKAITQVLSDMDAEIEALEIQKSKTQHIKQGMMQELLTGKTRLIKPAVEEIQEPLVLVTEPQPTYKKEEAHNQYITDAVLIGTMAHSFASKEYPLTRFMYTKVSYLFKRYKQLKDENYLKKAAGPYKPKTRYGGAEKIAVQNKYVVKQKSNYNGNSYDSFVIGERTSEAVNYFKKWYGTEDLEWIQQFKFTKRPILELWATVDMAMEDLKQDNKPVNLQSVKTVIKNNKEWKPKLKKAVFSDDTIREAIRTIPNLFHKK